MIVVPYEAQKNLYHHELQKRAVQEMDSKGKEWVDFPKDQIEIRTHQGAQGYEASVVIIDLVRSDSPGHTGHHEMVNVCSSRAICAQLVLVNTSVFKYLDSKASPYVRSLVSWVEFHTEKDMLVEMDVATAKEWRITCFKCHGFGHKGSECRYTTTKELLICPMPGCGGNHHPRDCDKSEKHRDSAVTTNKDQPPGATSKPSKRPATRSTRSEQSNRAMKKAAR